MKNGVGKGSQQSPKGVGGDRSASVIKALSILDLFDLAHRELGVGEISESLALPASTVHRLLDQLAANGYVENTGFGSYRLGLKAARIGALALHHLGFGGAIQPYMEAVAEQTHETVNIAVLDRQDIVYVAVLETRAVLRPYFAVGQRNLASRTALGKALLAFSVESPNWPSEIAEELERVRSEQVAYDLEDFEPGVHCIGVPILDENGRALAAISVAGPSTRMTLRHMRDAIPALREAANGIASSMLLSGSRNILRTAGAQDA